MNKNELKKLMQEIGDMNFKADSGEVFGIFQLKFKINQVIKRVSSEFNSLSDKEEKVNKK